MIPFYKIAVPHIDILEGRHTPDVFAAKLGQVFKGKGPLEYKNPAHFFRKRTKPRDSRRCYPTLRGG